MRRCVVLSHHFSDAMGRGEDQAFRSWGFRDVPRVVKYRIGIDAPGTMIDTAALLVLDLASEVTEEDSRLNSRGARLWLPGLSRC